MERLEFEQRVRDIGQILNYPVSFPEKQRTFMDGYLYTGDGSARITITHYCHEDRSFEGRFGVRGNYPQPIDGTYPHQQSPPIRFTEKKSAERMSKEIQRRFLHGYLSKLEDVLQWNAERNAVILQATEALKQVAAACGVEPHFNNNRESSGRGSIFVETTAEIKGFDARTYYSDSFTLTAMFKLDEMMRFVQFMKDLQREEANPDREKIGES